VRRDSQGLCFLGDVSLSDMISREIPKKKATCSMSRHGSREAQGAALYTLGERHGFELFSTSPHTEAHFIIAKDVEAEYNHGLNESLSSAVQKQTLPSRK
jgi:tRNA U34 2-thiouridine synthase MnmA/TrmU